jgi:hypothetical protein
MYSFAILISRGRWVMLKLLKATMPRDAFIDMLTEKALEEVINKFGINEINAKRKARLKEKLRGVAEELYDLI